MMHQGVIILQAHIIGYDINGNMTGGSVRVIRTIRQKNVLFWKEKVILQPFFQLCINLAYGTVVREILKRHTAFLIEFFFST